MAFLIFSFSGENSTKFHSVQIQFPRKSFVAIRFRKRVNSKLLCETFMPPPLKMLFSYPYAAASIYMSQAEQTGHATLYD